MAVIVEGLYKQGKIELLQPPANVPEGRVRVILIAEDRPKPPPRLLTFGMYRGNVMSTLEDFKEAEWHGEKELDSGNGQ